MQVRLTGSDEFGAESLPDIREDFEKLAQNLVLNSKVLLDFEGVQSFCPASFAAVVEFNKLLRIKGSRIVLCSLAPKVRESLFASRKQ